MSKEIKEVEEMLELFGPALTNYPPEIRNLEITTPIEYGTEETAEFDYTDEDGDINRVYITATQQGGAGLEQAFGGARGNGGFHSYQYPAAQVGISGTSGHALGSDTFFPDIGDVGLWDVLVWVTDAEGNVSNQLTQEVVVNDD